MLVGQGLYPLPSTLSFYQNIYFFLITRTMLVTMANVTNAQAAILLAFKNL